MTFYARRSWRLARQITADVFALLWTVLWWFLGRALDGAIRAVAGIERGAVTTLTGMRDQLETAAEQASRIPAVGPGLRKPFDEMAASLAGLANGLSGQASGIENIATLSGALVFAIPFLTMLALWLPRRLRFAALTREMRELAASPQGVELLAMRALITEPLRALTSVDPDPVGAWRSRDPQQLGRFANLELDSACVRVKRVSAA